MKKTEIDRQLGELIKKELPVERRDPWFVKKTMNRLPEKQAPLFSRWERLAYTLSGLLLVVLWCLTAVNIISNPVLTVSALMQPVMLTIVSLILIGAVSIPYLRRN
ncbi:MAG: hypothetical protein K2M07_00375 [Muribaculaceae bacterium]|nr:hypothetical protein [Muribaculaceae bacterium]